MQKPMSLIRGLYRDMLTERAEQDDSIVTVLEFFTSRDARSSEAVIAEQAPQAHVVPGQHMIQVTTENPVTSLNAIECIESAPARNIRVRFSSAVLPA